MDADATHDLGAGANRWRNIVASGVVTATSFVGDGQNLTNTGAVISAASGSQRVVLTDITSGIMTTAANEAALAYNASTNTLTAGVFNGSGANLTSIPNGALATASSSNTAGNIVVRDGSGNFSAGTITAALSGNVTGNLTGNVTGALTGPVAVSAASTDQSYFVPFVSGTSGNRRIEVNSNLTFNPSTQTFSNSSDERLKSNITPIEDSIEKIKQLRGVEFDWNESGAHSIGVIAQDVEKVFPELVSEREDGMKGVDYGKLSAVLIEVVKEQQKQIDWLKERDTIVRTEILANDDPHHAPYAKLTAMLVEQINLKTNDIHNLNLQLEEIKARLDELSK